MILATTASADSAYRVGRDLRYGFCGRSAFNTGEAAMMRLQKAYFKVTS